MSNDSLSLIAFYYLLILSDGWKGNFYGIKMAVEERFTNKVEVRLEDCHDAVRELTKRGLVKLQSRSFEEKHALPGGIYEITPAGEEFLQAEVRSLVLRLGAYQAFQTQKEGKKVPLILGRMEHLLIAAAKDLTLLGKDEFTKEELLKKLVEKMGEKLPEEDVTAGPLYVLQQVGCLRTYTTIRNETFWHLSSLGWQFAQSFK